MSTTAWQLEQTSPTTLELFIPAVHGRFVIATLAVGFDEPWESMQRAHALLLKAAPAMLEKLEELVSECAECHGTGGTIDQGGDCPDCSDIRAVIAQAKGAA